MYVRALWTHVWRFRAIVCLRSAIFVPRELLVAVDES